MHNNETTILQDSDNKTLLVAMPHTRALLISYHSTNFSCAHVHEREVQGFGRLPEELRAHLVEVVCHQGAIKVGRMGHFECTPSQHQGHTKSKTP